MSSSDLRYKMTLLAKLADYHKHEILKFDAMLQHLLHYKHQHKWFLKSVVIKMMKFEELLFTLYRICNEVVFSE